MGQGKREAACMSASDVLRRRVKRVAPLLLFLMFDLAVLG